MSLSISGGSAFTPQSLVPDDPPGVAHEHGQNSHTPPSLFGGGNDGSVNFAPPSSRIEGTAATSASERPHRSTQSSANEVAGIGLEDVINLLQSILQGLLKLLGGNSADNAGGEPDAAGGGAGCSSSPGDQNSVTPQDPSAQAGAGPSVTQGADDASSIADVGKAPNGMPQNLWKDCVSAGNKFGVDPYVLAAQSKQESNFGQDLSGASGGDGVMQVEPSTRAAYGGQFQEKMGHAYDHSSQSDQVAMAALIMGSKGGDTTAQLQKYNGGDNWQPGATDSYGRVIKADEYAASVNNIAQELRNSVT